MGKEPRQTGAQRHRCALDKEKSRIRVRVEHVFGAEENEMGSIFLRSIGLARAKVGVALMNLTYNLKRVEVLIRKKVFAFDRVSPSAICGCNLIFSDHRPACK